MLCWTTSGKRQGAAQGFDCNLERNQVTRFRDSDQVARAGQDH